MIRKRNCDECGTSYEARNSRSQFCSDACRVRKYRGAASAPGVDGADSPLVRAVREELHAIGKVDTMLGQLALLLAGRLSAVQTPAGAASLSRELHRVVTAAQAGLSPWHRRPD